MLIILINSYKEGKLHFTDIFSTSIIISFLVIFICEIIADVTSKFIKKKCEDAAKLTTDYNSLIKMYSREPIYKDLPCVVLAKRNLSSMPFNIVFKADNKDSKYQLPKQVADNSNTLMTAHSQSNVYNQICIRINDIITNNNDIMINYMRTIYYDSLITNRALDYTLPNVKTIRNIYEPGPFLSSLSQFRLSNHLGFNGFVELNDDRIIFVERNDRVSIGKNTIGTSVGASYKVKYGVDDEFNITNKTLGNAIKSEIYDELKLNVEKYGIDSSKLYSAIFSFYRDIVEG